MKFKNIKNKAKKQQSPSNSRTIPESFMFAFSKISSSTFLKIYRGTLKVFIALSFLLAVAIVGLDLDTNIKVKQSIDLERKKLTNELIFWESFIAKHKDYRDAYLQGSVLEYRLGNTPKAKMYAEKAFALDPNSQGGRKIEELLNK